MFPQLLFLKASCIVGPPTCSFIIIGLHQVISVVIIRCVFSFERYRLRGILDSCVMAAVGWFSRKY
jgi:hypothetical protein